MLQTPLLITRQSLGEGDGAGQLLDQTHDFGRCIPPDTAGHQPPDEVRRGRRGHLQHLMEVAGGDIDLVRPVQTGHQTGDPAGVSEDAAVL